MSITMTGIGGHLCGLLWLLIILGAPILAYRSGKDIGRMDAEQKCWDKHVEPHLEDRP